MVCIVRTERSYSGVEMSPMRDERTTREDRATQLLICKSLSFATDLHPLQFLGSITSQLSEKRMHIDQ